MTVYTIPTSSRPIVISEPDHPALVAAILTRRLRKCIAEGAHPGHEPGAAEQVKCPRCGL